jgi:hypothetical protein
MPKIQIFENMPHVTKNLLFICSNFSTKVAAFRDEKRDKKYTEEKRFSKIMIRVFDVVIGHHQSNDIRTPGHSSVAWHNLLSAN